MNHPVQPPHDSVDSPRPLPPPYRALVRLLSHPSAAPAVVVFSFVSLLCGLDTGLSADDYIHMLVAQGSGEIEGMVRAPLDMFHFASPGVTEALIREGVISFWADPQAQLAFLRPLSALTHYVDYNLWPNQPWLMHLHSALWGLLALGGVLALYRRLLPAGFTLALAIALYALDDGRAWFVSWIATRNSVIATALSAWALYHYVRGRQQARRFNLWAAVGLYGLALLAGEGSISVCAYVFAFALFLDTGSRTQRLLSLWPFAAVTVVWRVVYRSLGYGARGSGLYFDPLSQPMDFLAGLFERGPVLLLAQLGGVWSDVYTAFYPYRTILDGLWLAGALATGVLCYLLWPLWRGDARFRFGVTGALLSLLPATAVFPADRMLCWVAIGASLALAHAISRYLQDPLAFAGLRRGLAVPVMGLLILCNLVVNPAFLWSRARGNEVMREILDRSHAGVPTDPDIEQRFVVYLNPPAVAMAGYIAVERAALGIPRPGQQYWLAAGVGPVVLERLGAETLRVQPAGGYLGDEQAWLLRAQDSRFEVGQEFQLNGLTMRVEGVNEAGRPSSMTARFDHPLEDPRYLFVGWQDGRWRTVTPPAQGQTLTLPKTNHLRTLMGEKFERLPNWIPWDRWFG